MLISWRSDTTIRSTRTSHTCELLVPATQCAFSLPGTMGTSLLDPSCSGSGIVNRLDHLTEQGMSQTPYFFLLIGYDAKTQIMKMEVISLNRKGWKNSRLSSS